jgi:hypothetical protein
MVVARVGVETGGASIHHHFPQETCNGELVESVIDGGEGNLDARVHSLVMKRLCGDVAIFLAGRIE